MKNKTYKAVKASERLPERHPKINTQSDYYHVIYANGEEDFACYRYHPERWFERESNSAVPFDVEYWLEEQEQEVKQGGEMSAEKIQSVAEFINPDKETEDSYWRSGFTKGAEWAMEQYKNQ